MADQQPATGGASQGSTGAQQGTGTGPDATGQQPATGEPDLAAEVAKWKDLARQNEARAKANAHAAERLQQLEESQKTEQQRLAERAERAERERDTATAAVLRYEVAAAKGVPADLAVLLTGTAREDLEAAADLLLKHLANNHRDEDRAPATPPASAVAGNGSPAGSRQPRDIFASMMRG